MNETRAQGPAGDASRRFLALLRRELRRARLAHASGALPAALTAAALLLALIALWIRLAPPVDAAAGTRLAIAAWVCLLAPFLLAFAWPWRRLPNARRLLAEAERRAETRQLLETAADVAEGRLEGKGYSPGIMAHLLERAVASATAGLPAPPTAAWRRRLAILGALLAPAALLLLVLSSPTGIRPGGLLLSPSDPGHYAERAWLEVAPGSVELLAGSPLRLELRERGLPWRFPGELKLEIDETGDLFRAVRLARDGDAWVHERDAVYQGFSYRVRRGRSGSETFRVDVYHAPVLDSLRIGTRPPAYTGLAERQLDLRSGEIALPAGSRLALAGFSSSALSAAWLHFEDGDSLALAVDGERLAGELRVEEDLRLAVGLRDTRGTETRTPLLLTVRAVPDAAPQVEFLAPGPDEDLNRDLFVTLEMAAADDYGVADLRIRSLLTGEADTLSLPLPLDGRPAPRVALRHPWDLAPLDLFPGDVVEYWAEVEDNRPGRPGFGKSRVQRLRVPSITEIYEAIEEGDRDRGENLSEMLEEGSQLQEDLRRLEQELRADPEIDWEREEELRAALERQQKMAEQLEELSRGLSERNEKLGENEMLREQMAEKMERIQELVDELRDTEAGEILRRFQEMVESLDPDTLPEELKNLRMDQEQLLEQLERTEAMLEQVMREQRMDALLEQVDEMLERQEQLRAETDDWLGEEDEERDEEAGGEEADAEDSDAEESEGEESGEPEDADTDPAEGEQQNEGEELTERQEKLAEDAEELTEQIREEAEELAEDFPEQAEQMEEAAKPESESNPSQPMRDAGEQMRESDPGANSSQQDASERLLKLYWRLVKAQQGMMGAMEQMSMEALGRVTRHALELSLREEDEQLEMQRRHRLGYDPEMTRRSARRQMSLYQSLERVREELLETAKQTLGVSPKAMSESRAALEALANSIAELESANLGAGLQSAGESVGHLNETVIELLEGIQSEGGGGGSCSNPLQSMQDMLQRQQQLNKDSRSKSESMGGGGLSMKDRAEMQRLKAEQQAIREGMEEMVEGEGELLGRLDRIIDDMKEVEKDFEGGRISEETLRRQEKIFERLLDAQRSVHQRDYKQKRRSRSADELEPLWPEHERLDDPLEKLRDEIRRGLGDAAPPEYEELIQEYYRSLLESEEELP